MLGLGLGTSFVPATLLITDGVPADRAGVAAGVVNSGRQIGRAVGLAALSGLVTAALVPPTSPERIAHGTGRAFEICAVLAALGVLLVTVLLPRGTGADRPAARSTPDPLARR